MKEGYESRRSVEDSALIALWCICAAIALILAVVIWQVLQGVLA